MVALPLPGSARLAVVVASLLAGCRDPGGAPGIAPSATASARAPSASARAAVASAPVVDAGDGSGVVVRTRGPLRARFAPEKASYVLGEPMLLVLEATNTGADPLVLDDRSGRYTWAVQDERGERLCESGGSTGRLGSEHVATIRVGPGETLRETRLLNGRCDAFARSGRYVVSVRRVLAEGDVMAPARGCDDLDPRARGAGAPEPSGSGPACADLRDFPAVATRFPVEVGAWDAGALRSRLATLPDERAAAWSARDLSREGSLSAYGDWFCDHVRCDCPPTWNRYGKWMEKAIARVPEKMGQGCRSR